MHISKFLLAGVIVITASFGVRAADNAKQAAARAALLQALGGETTQTQAPPVMPVPPAAPETNAPAPPAPPVVEVTPGENAATNTATTTAAPPAAPTMDTNTAPAVVPLPPSSPAPVTIIAPITNNPTPPVVSQPITPTMPITPTTPQTSTGGFAPIVAPPLPVSAAQEAQLQSLLEQYKANQITPAQYQAERQKILSEP